MHSILERDLRQLMLDAEKVQKGVEILEHDHTALAGECRKDDLTLTQLITNIDRLDFDLSTILSDYVSLGRQYWKDHNLSVIKNLHNSFAIISNVFKDLKEVRTALIESCNNPLDLRQVGRDWERFKKSISQLQKFMKYAHGRRKNRAWVRKSSLKAEGGS